MSHRVHRHEINMWEATKNVLKNANINFKYQLKLLKDMKTAKRVILYTIDTGVCYFKN